MKNAARIMTVIAVALTVFEGLASAGDFFGKDNGALAQAQAAYLRGDLVKMTSEMKAALMAQPTDPVVRENVLALLKKTYESRCGQGVPADWRLPDEIGKMKISVRRKEKDTSEYALKVFGNNARLHLIKQLRVTRYPDQVVLDKQAGIGEWSEEAGKNGEDPEYTLQGRKSRQPVPAGLYLLRIELTNGKATDGWFLIDDELNSSATPDVATPAIGETFQTGNPTFRWTDFRSPQYRACERRSVWLGVSRAEPPNYDWDEKWSFWADAPSFEDISVGSSSNGTSIGKLDAGRYIFVIDFHERRWFGDIQIGRDSVTTRPFSVR